MDKKCFICSQSNIDGAITNDDQFVCLDCMYNGQSPQNYPQIEMFSCLETFRIFENSHKE